ncbi:MAG: hypothetical protein E6R13_05765 [Spirochaetes bacterium]|nr:MAG: hypothetical protein E6R13_05765 [Spirochaetota bacterium]
MSILLTPILCMAINSYHEARGTSQAEQEAVNKVVMARAEKSHVDYCAVVFKKNQFSWANSVKRKDKFHSYKEMLSYYNIQDEKSWINVVGLAYISKLTHKDKDVIYYHDKSIKSFKDVKGVSVAYTTKNFVFYKTY